MVPEGAVASPEPSSAARHAALASEPSASGASGQVSVTWGGVASTRTETSGAALETLPAPSVTVTPEMVCTPPLVIAIRCS